MVASRAVASTSSTPRTERPSLRLHRCCGVSCVPVAAAVRSMCSIAESRNPPVPQAGSTTVSSGVGRIASTMAWISGRGVKYCPAPDFTSVAERCNRAS